jgi:DNA-3-methyladenine glycosylase II
MAIFKYGTLELEYLKKKDKKLGLVIEHIGPIEREIMPDLFAALVHSVVGQQIAAKAAATVWARIRTSCGVITPQTLADATAEQIQQCGLSMRKALYIKGIGEAAMRGELNVAEFPGLSDSEIIARLSSLTGVGIWTAEMLLIFSLERPDIVSWGDLAIRRGMMNLYGLTQLSKDQFDRYRKRYSPYGSVASLYLWALAARKPL